MRQGLWFWLVFAFVTVVIAERLGIPPRVALAAMCVIWLLLLLAGLGVF